MSKSFIIILLALNFALLAQNNKQDVIKKGKTLPNKVETKELPTKTLPKKEKKENIRVEIEVDKGSSDDYQTITMGQYGLITFFETEEKENKQASYWQFDKYNTNLQKEWSKKEGVSRNLSYVKHYSQDNKLFILFSQKGTFSNIYRYEYEIISIDVKSGEIKSINQPLEINAAIEDFVVINNNAFVAGKIGTSKRFKRKMCCLTCLTLGTISFCKSMRYEKTDGFVITLNLSSGKSNLELINTGEKSDSKVASLSVDNKNGIVNALVHGKQKETGIQLFIRQYDPTGKLKNLIKLDTDDANELYTAEITNTAANEMIIVGTYGKRNLISTSMSENQMASNGLYLCKIVNNSQKFIKFYPFSDFKNFFGYLSTKTEQKIEEKIEKRKEKGKSVDVSYSLLTHEIILKNNNYYFVGECFYPEYHTEVYYTTDANGRSVRQTRRVFDGYRYTHAIITKFDLDGKMLWDASFPIWDILTFNLKERVAVLTDRSAITMVYSHGGYLKSKVVDGNNLKDGSENTPIELSKDDDKLKNSWGNDINFWYDKCFIAWGYQKIKNTKDENVKRKRNVFYLNKVYFD